MISSDSKSWHRHDSSKVESSLNKEPKDSSNQTVLMICKRCKERLMIEVDPEEMAQNLKGGLFTVEVPHGGEDPHSTIFYLSMSENQVQVRGQVTASHLIESINQEEKTSNVTSLPTQVPPSQTAPESELPQKPAQDITTFLVGLSIFLLGIALALEFNYNLSSSCMFASYLSLGVILFFKRMRSRKRSTGPKKKNIRIPQLGELEGISFQDPETGSLMLTNQKTTRLLTAYNLKRSNESQLPLTVLTSSMSQRIPLLYMRLGNRHGLLAVEQRIGGGKQRQGIWEKPKIPEHVQEIMAYHVGIVESGLSAGGTEFDKMIEPGNLSWRLKLAPSSDFKSEKNIEL